MHAVKRGCVLAAVVWFAWAAAPGAQDLPVLSTSRSLAAGHFALEIDGAFMGWLESFEGGNGFGDIVELEVANLPYPKKHLGNAGYRSIKLNVGASMSPAFYNWIKASLEGQFIRASGAIVGVDFKGTERSRVEFLDARLSELEFPALDGSSKSPVTLLATLEPEQTRRVAASGQTYKASLCNTKAKAWLAANFRLKIDGLDTSKARAIDPLRVKIILEEAEPGEGRLPGVRQRLSFSHLVFEVSEAGAESLNAWFDDFVIRGINGDDNEKTGSLEYLTPDLSATIFTVNFHHLGIFELASAPAASNDQIKALVASMYVENFVFVPGAVGCGA